MNLVHHNKLFPPIWKLGMKWLINSIVHPEGRFFMGIALAKPQIDYYGILTSLYIPFYYQIILL